MGLLRWFSKNWANTTDPTHGDLKPLLLEGTLADGVGRLKLAAAKLRGWRLEAETPTALHFVRRTRVFRFADDIRLSLAENDGAVRIDAESRSRLGKGDLGQNRRNILELWDAVAAISPRLPG